MSDGRLPAHLEVAAFIRAAESAGGFATVIAKGERDAGVVVILTTERGENARLWERMPSFEGPRAFAVTWVEGADSKDNISDYIARRRARDPDMWVLELDIAEAERFVAELLH